MTGILPIAVVGPVFQEHVAPQIVDGLSARVVFVSRTTHCGDWEYPGQAYRHILAETDGLRSMLAALEAENARLRAGISEIESGIRSKCKAYCEPVYGAYGKHAAECMAEYLSSAKEGG